MSVRSCRHGPALVRVAGHVVEAPAGHGPQAAAVQGLEEPAPRGRVTRRGGGTARRTRAAWPAARRGPAARTRPRRRRRSCPRTRRRFTRSRGGDLAQRVHDLRVRPAEREHEPAAVDHGAVRHAAEVAGGATMAPPFSVMNGWWMPSRCCSASISARVLLEHSTSGMPACATRSSTCPGRPDVVRVGGRAVSRRGPSR